MSSGFSFGLPSSSSSFGTGTGLGTGTSTSTGSGLNLSGIKPLTTANPTTGGTTGFSFGGLGGTGGGGASTGFSLGGGSGATTTTGGLTLGGGATSTTTAPTTGGLTLGGAPSTTTATTGGGLGLGLGLGGSGTTTTPGLGLGLGSGLNTSTSTQPTLSLGLGGGLGGSTALGGTTAASSTTATTQPTAATVTSSTAQAPITFKVLEDYINKWMGDLDSQEKDFLNQATQLNALDKLMVENGDKIIDLSNEVTRLTNDQDQLEQELNFIYSQQNDLEQTIKKLEQGIEQMPLIIPQQLQQPSPYFQPAISGDTSRIEMYKLLIEVDNQLKSTSCDLKEIIKRLNDTNVNLNDPIVQISKILNSHMDSLNWIEENSVMLQNQVDKVANIIDERYREPDSTTSRFLFLSRD